MKRAILFLNLGGPETQADVKPFLYRLFEDPEIIRVPFAPLRKLIAWALSSAREKESRSMYRKIGGGSPIRRLTDAQAAATQLALEKRGATCTVQTAFNCSHPFIEDVVQNLAKEGVQKILAFPLYPQYSFTTTKGALDRARHAVKNFAPHIKVTEICSWPTHPLFLKAHAELIDQAVQCLTNPDMKKVHLVFSAHSIPEKLVTQLGDPYRRQMEETVKGVIEKTQWKGPWTLSWQSKLGPVKWIGPSTEDTLKRLGKLGTPQVLVTPIAFVTDHIETLYELDQMMAVVAKEAGISQYIRVPSLNCHPTFIEALSELALEQKEFWD